MKRRSILYLIVALALLLAPVATSAAPSPLELGAAGVNLANLQPAAPDKPFSSACASLDNPKIRPLMSGMYETSLLIACGRQNELGQVTSKPTAGTLDGQAPELGTDVLVNNPARRCRAVPAIHRAKRLSCAMRRLARSARPTTTPTSGVVPGRGLFRL